MPEWTADLVSVIMPAHNSESLLEESARSVMAQSYPNWELLIIDDASRDRTLALARELAAEDERIRVVALPENVGVAQARNHGIRTARGQFIAFLDSDDLWLPEKLKVQTDFMRQTGSGFTFAQYRRFKNQDGLSKPIRVPAQVTYDQLLHGNVIGCLTVMIDRARIPEISMPTVKHEDYVTWLSLLKRGNTAWGIPRDLARYRVAATSVSGNKKLSAGWTWEIYRRTEGLSVLKSLRCFVHYGFNAIYNRCFY